MTNRKTKLCKDLKYFCRFCNEQYLTKHNIIIHIFKKHEDKIIGIKEVEKC